MGLFDRLADKAKEAAAEARKVAEKTASDVAECARKASAEGNNIFDKVGMSASELSVWAKSMPDKLKKMADDFDVDALWDKLTKTAAKAGQELIVMVLTIYYAIESKIPKTSKQTNGTTKQQE